MIRLCFYRNPLVMLCMLLLVTVSLSAQLNPPMGTSPWGFANPKPVGYTLTDMSFIDDQTGLAVGVNGGILRTTDGGRNWVGIPFKYVTPANSVVLASFADVHFVTPGIAYAVGLSGVMVKSTDGGITWTQINTPLTALSRNINALHFLNKDTGYIGGAALTSANTTSINDAPKIYITRNGGASWDSLATPFRPQQNAVTLSGFNSAEIHRIHFVNDSVGYASGSCGQATPTYSAILWKIEKNVVKDYSIHRSKFGISATTGTYAPATQTYKGLVGVNDSLVLISSMNNNIVIRVRTGKNDSTANAVPAVFGNYERGVYEIVIWLTSTATPFPANLVTSVAGQMQQLKKQGNKIFLTAGNSILTSGDNGTNWKFTKPHPANVLYPHWGFNAMDILPNGRIVIGSFNGLTYDSLPGAPAWQTVYKNERPLFYAFNDLDWADVCNGVAVGSNGSILKTTDGGRNWTNNSNPVFEAAQISIGFVQYRAVNNMIFTAGTSIYQSTDQGASLNNTLFTEPNPNTSGITGFTMTSNDRAYAIAYRFSPAVERTVIFRTLNASAATPVWDTVKTFPNGTLAPQLRNIKFANQDTGYVSGSRGKIYRTVNGGTTWTDVSPDTTVNGNASNNYTGLSVVSGKILFVSGSSRKLFKSTDAGQTWQDLTIAVPATASPVIASTALTNIIMNDVNNGYIQAGGTLMRTTDSWATWAFDLAPNGMSNISLYPKLAGPLSGKKVYAVSLSAGSPTNSVNSAFLVEYGTATLSTVATTEVVTDASCTNPTGTITVTTTGGVAPYTYSINGGPFQASNVFAGLTAGPKTVVIKDAGCQEVTKTLTVGFNNNVTLSTNNDTTVCTGATVTLQANSLAGATYSWSPTTGLSSATVANPTFTANAAASYTVTATLNSCTLSKTVQVAVRPNPVVSAGPDKSIAAGNSVQLEGSAATATSVSWTPATGLSNPAILTPMAQPMATTSYTLTVRDANNCSASDDVLVTVMPDCIKVMDAFTPNGDGLNELWVVTNNACAVKADVAVYNRYGTEVYHNKDYKNDWNGTWNGKPVPDGVYYYKITLNMPDRRLVPITGHVTILR